MLKILSCLQFRNAEQTFVLPLPLSSSHPLSILFISQTLISPCPLCFKSCRSIFYTNPKSSLCCHYFPVFSASTLLLCSTFQLLFYLHFSDRSGGILFLFPFLRVFFLVLPMTLISNRLFLCFFCFRLQPMICAACLFTYSFKL